MPQRVVLRSSCIELRASNAERDVVGKGIVNDSPKICRLTLVAFKILYGRLFSGPRVSPLCRLTLVYWQLSRPKLATTSSTRFSHSSFDMSGPYILQANIRFSRTVVNGKREGWRGNWTARVYPFKNGSHRDSYDYPRYRLEVHGLGNGYVSRGSRQYACPHLSEAYRK